MSSTARRAEPRGVAQLGQRDQGARDLRGHVDALGRVDADAEARDEPVELTLRQRPQDVGQTVRRCRARARSAQVGQLHETTAREALHFQRGLRVGRLAEEAAASSDVAACHGHTVVAASGAALQAAEQRRGFRGRGARGSRRQGAVGAGPHITTHELPSVSEGRTGDACREPRAHGAPGAGDALDVASALAGEGLEGAWTSSTWTRPSRRRRRTCTRRGSTGPADGRVVRARAYDDRWEASARGVPRDARAAARGARAAARRPRAPLGARRLARLVPGAGAARRDPRARRLRERDRLAPGAEPRAAGGEPPVRADARHARRLRRPEARLVPPTRLEPIEPGRCDATTKGGPSRARRAATTPTRRSRAWNARAACTGRRAARSTSSTSW